MESSCDRSVRTHAGLAGIPRPRGSFLASLALCCPGAGPSVPSVPAHRPSLNSDAACICVLPGAFINGISQEPC